MKVEAVQRAATGGRALASIVAADLTDVLSEIKTTLTDKTVERTLAKCLAPRYADSVPCTGEICLT